MSAIADDPVPSRFSEVRVSRAALDALAGVPGLQCGPLSVLARLEPSGQPADAAALQSFLTDLAQPFDAVVPVLLDPHLTADLAVADGRTQIIGQYAWPDPPGLQPGFKLLVHGDGVGLAGPVTPEDVSLGLFELLQLGTVPEPEATRLDLTTDQFWALAALADAGSMTAAARRAAHVAGSVAGVRWDEIAACWQRSLEERDLAWAVTLAAAMLPEALPTGNATRLQETLAEMEEAGLLVLLAADAPDDPLGDVYVLGEALEDLCGALGAGTILFGLGVRRRVGETDVERAAVLGWRTFGGVILADLSRLPEGSVTILRVGPSQFTELLALVLDLDHLDSPLGAPFVPFCDRAALLQVLNERQAPAPEPAFCANCGARLTPGWRFCSSCGRPVEPQ